MQQFVIARFSGGHWKSMGNFRQFIAVKIYTAPKAPIILLINFVRLITTAASSSSSCLYKPAKSLQWQGTLTDDQAAGKGWGQSGLPRQKAVCSCCSDFSSWPEFFQPDGETNRSTTGMVVCPETAKTSLINI